jgi:hypothetical protein
VDLSPNNVSASIASNPISSAPTRPSLSLFPPRPDNRFRTLNRVTLGNNASTTSLASSLAVPASVARLPPSARTATSTAIAAIAFGESVRLRVIDGIPSRARPRPRARRARRFPPALTAEISSIDRSRLRSVAEIVARASIPSPVGRARAVRAFARARAVARAGDCRARVDVDVARVARAGRPTARRRRARRVRDT